MSDIEQWNTLTKAWREAEAAAIKAQEEMDACVADHLEGKAVCPTAKMQEDIEELRFHAYNARGALDEFLSHRFR